MTARQFEFSVPPFRLECGVALPTLHLRGWTAGPEGDFPGLHRRARVLPDRPSEGPVARTAAEIAELPHIDRTTTQPAPSLPTVLVVHALTADARVGGDAGWWSALVGPGRALDTRNVRVLAFNNLGSCYGSFGPADETFPRRHEVDSPLVPQDLKGRFELPDDVLPAPLTPWDQARAILLGLDALGIERVDAVLGGSLGGMIALCLAALAPARFRAVIPVATAASASPWVLGFNHIGRQLVAEFGARGLELARQVAHMTYRSEDGLQARQGRRRAPGGHGIAWPYAVQTYLEHQGGKLRRRFDPHAYLAQLDAMDHHDLGRRPPDPAPHERWEGAPGPSGAWGQGRLSMPVHAAAIRNDVLFPPAQLLDLVKDLQNRGTQASLQHIDHPQGHDGFLLATEAIGDLVLSALTQARRGEAP